MTSFFDFLKRYPDDDACLDGIMQTRYGGTELECPRCHQHARFYRVKRERSYVCQHCKHQLFPCVGTPMERSRTPLTKWFFAMYMFATSRHGVSAKELERQLGVTYKCAWRIAHEIRKFMADIDKDTRLRGDVEVDETYVGGRRRGLGRGYLGNKGVVVALVQRGGPVKTKVVPNVRKRTLEPFITASVERGSRIHSDELRSYQGLPKAGYWHTTVNHSRGEYVFGNAHVNSVEGFWSRLKNSIRGTHIWVSRKHLWKYAKEFEYRYNRRANPGAIFGDLVAAL